MYANGKGVPKDLLRGYMWWNIASEQSDPTAWQNLAAISQMMTKKQIAEAHPMARTCQASHYKQCD
jgi:hypothetical protein